ncbi:hypothetical protein EV121DRAFT_173308, partial [Schizophyllum commune]
KESAWSRCNQVAELYDEELCKTYRGEIDSFLVFAGLFSSAVTAFSIDAYKWIQDDPNERTARLLTQLIAVTASQNGLAPPETIEEGPSISGSVAIRLNAYWFLSLILALSSAVVGILCKQWLRRYERDLSRTRDVPEALGVRQMKYEGIIEWKIGAIVSSVPILLLCALVLFLVGIVELLLQLHRSIAVPAAIAVGAIVLFMLATTLLPLIQYATRAFSAWSLSPQCPFKSPQSWLFLRFGMPLIDALLDLTSGWPGHSHSSTSRASQFSFGLGKRLTMNEAWADIDVHWTRAQDAAAAALTADTPVSLYRALAWLLETADDPALRSSIWHCLWD